MQLYSSDSIGEAHDYDEPVANAGLAVLWWLRISSMYQYYPFQYQVCMFSKHKHRHRHQQTTTHRP